MSLLHQDSPQEIDGAARGEEFTKGSSHVVLAAFIAALLVTVVVVAFVLASRKPPVATGEIVQVWAHPTHGETPGVDANGEAMAKETFNQVLIFAHVKLQNQSKNPIALENLLINAIPGDGIPLSVSAGSKAQYEEAFLAYPELAALHTDAFVTHKIIAPGESVDGTAFWVLRLSKEEWDARKDWQPNPEHGDPGSKFGLNFTFSIQYQPNIVLAPQTEVIEQ
ncbi:MAG: hypothetical protein ABSF70_09135 [Terracidiphilus sp.]|jgi:hypothetical protein